MELYKASNLDISKVQYEQFLNILEKNISEIEFKKSLEKTKVIDEKYYSENITVEELKRIIGEYMKKDIIKEKNINKIQVILSGNPEYVFRLGIEAIRNNVRMIINIDDFCLAQNIILVELINKTVKEMKLANILKLQNLIKDEEIIEISKNVDMTLCFGNSNDFNRLNKKSKISNLKLFPFNIFELYSDSYELEIVRRGLYDYTTRNQFEIEIYDMDLDIEEVIKEMNDYGYGFCSILLSKDKEKINKFKENIKSKYVFVNENPFNKINFDFDIRKL